MLVLGMCFTLLTAGPSTAAIARDGRRPNILFIIADDWSWGHAGVYGCKWIQTPTFDRVAREGALFSNAFTNNPKCSPCRASILTGRNTWQLEEAMCHFGLFRARWPVYPELMERAGYHVGHTGKGWGPGDFQTGGFTRNPAGPAYQKFKRDPPLQGMTRIDYAQLRRFPRGPQGGSALLLLGGGPRTPSTLRGRLRPPRVASSPTSRCRPICPTRASSGAIFSTTVKRSSGLTPRSARSLTT